jgi:ankyrin repeat protein
MSGHNSFKDPEKEKDQFNNIKSLLKDKNLNPKKINDLKDLFSLTINPAYKRFNLEYLIIFLLKYLNEENEPIFYQYFFHYCELGKLQNVKIFLENNMDVNRQNEFGETPLHIAISKNDVDLVKLLIKYEPDTNIPRYKDKLTVMNYADICGNQIIIKMIKNLNEINQKKLIKNEIFDCINKGINNINYNSSKDASSFMKGNITNIDQIQNYNGEKMSFVTDEDMSNSILTMHLNKKIPSNNIANYSDSKYINTQTIINESDYCEETTPKNKNILIINSNEKNKILLHDDNNINNLNKKIIKQMTSEAKLFSSSLKRRDDNHYYYNNSSINPSYIQSLTTCHTLNKDHNNIESTSPIIHRNMSLKQIIPINKKEKLYRFIQEINLPKEYADNLLENGFDVLDVLISQTKKGTALSYENLRDIGVKLPGERAKILVHLEEISGNFDFLVESEIIYEKQMDYNDDSLYNFLCLINCENYINNFIDNGYYNAELLYMQMACKQPLNEDILINELGLNKNISKKILCNLIENSNKYINKLKNKYKEKEDKSKYIIFEENNNNVKSCDMCFVI